MMKTAMLLFACLCLTSNAWAEEKKRGNDRVYVDIAHLTITINVTDKEALKVLREEIRKEIDNELVQQKLSDITDRDYIWGSK